MEKIYIVEDNFGILKSLELYLINSGYEVIIEESGEKAVENILENKPDLIILDINLPGKNGLEICKELRKTITTPIIMLTARNTETDKLNAFNSGADDYIAKPFSPRELLARIKSISRRIGKKEEKSNNIKFDNIEINLDKMKVYISGQEEFFTKNEFDILKKIIEESGKIVYRQELMDLIGYSEYLFDRTIDTHIKNIRKKIKNKDIILTVRGEGYRLNT
ncbi:MAG: response regulator transcription factor [Candidatus Gracilibacteria bacterium]|nr:response regulator transcription factor [Candidatus Gracilibacteria bacterium]